MRNGLADELEGGSQWREMLGRTETKGQSRCFSTSINAVATVECGREQTRIMCSVLSACPSIERSTQRLQRRSAAGPDTERQRKR